MKKKVAVNLGFALSLILLGALMYWPGYLFEEFISKDRDESYVFTLTLQLNDLLRALKSESHAQRDVIATGSDEGMETYRAAVRRVDENLSRLFELTKDKPRYRMRLSAILPLIEKRHALLRSGLDNGLRNPATKELIREIRNEVSNLKEQLLRDLRSSSAQQQKSLYRIRILMIVKSVLAAVLMTTVFVLLRREIARQALEEAVLTKDRDQLDELVSQRTSELVKANELLKNEMAVRRKTEFALFNLNRHTAFVREEERRNISRDIHDEIGQSLTALKLDLAWIEHKFAAGNGEFVGHLDEMKSFLDRLISKVQNIIAELRPPLLDSLGVADAIQWQVSEFRRRNGISCDLSVDEKINGVGMQIATAVVRILMEALTNISRHAQATRVQINLKVERDRILLRVTDNGRGLTQADIDSPTSFGLLGMQERAALCDGFLTFGGAPSGGTVVTASLPLGAQGEAS